MAALGKIKALALTGLSPLWAGWLRLRGVRVGSCFTCIGRPGINRKLGTSIELGDGVTLCNTGIANPLAESGRCRLATLAPGARILVGDRVGLSAAIVCAATEVRIGDGTLIGGGAMIVDTDFHPRAEDGSWATDPVAVSRPVLIGRNCFIGARAIVLKGVTIGDGAVVGAGAVVTRDVAAGDIVAGNPAQVVRSGA